MRPSGYIFRALFIPTLYIFLYLVNVILTVTSLSFTGKMRCFVAVYHRLRPVQWVSDDVLGPLGAL